jgi:putative toxin-antitoxin system antitoxin component (TIGR02293 family)
LFRELARQRFRNGKFFTGGAQVFMRDPSHAPGSKGYALISTSEPSSGEVIERKAHIGWIEGEEALYAPGHSGKQTPLYRMPTSFLSYLKEYSEQEIYSLVVPKRTLARRKAANEPLSVEETDKALRLARIARLAEKVFEDTDKAGRWMRKPKRALGGDPPLVYLASESGAQVVENLLYQIDSGTAA